MVIEKRSRRQGVRVLVSFFLLHVYFRDAPPEHYMDQWLLECWYYAVLIIYSYYVLVSNKNIYEVSTMVGDVR